MRFTKQQGNGFLIALVFLAALALAYFEGLGSDRQSAEWYFQRGQEQQAQHKAEEALNYFAQAINIAPDYAEAYAGRCAAYSVLQNYEEALVACNQSLELQPQLLEGYLHRCLVFAYTEAFEEALNDCNAAIELAPSSSTAYTHRGIVYAQSDNRNLAMEDFDEAIALNSANANAYYHRGLNSLELELYPEAVDDLLLSIEKDVMDWRPYMVLTSLYYDTGYPYYALEIAMQMVERLPDNPYSYYTRGVIYSLESRLPEAEADFLRIIELDADFKDAYLELGYLYIERGAEERALGYFCQYLEHGGEISGYLSFTINDLGECPASGEESAEATETQP